MRIWIDATDPRSELQIFGMTLLERQLHTIITAGLEPREVCVGLPSNSESLPSLPDHLAQRLPLRWLQDQGQLQERLGHAVRAANGEPLLVLEADSVVDARLLQYLAERTGSVAACGGEGTERAAVVRLEESVPAAGAVDARLPKIADVGIARGALKEVCLAEVPDYTKKLHPHLPVYLFRLTDEASRERAERFLFWSHYKDSTDSFDKYIYPPLVWRIVRPLARWRVHPNMVTLFTIIITFAAVPLFAQGYWVAGLLLAYTMSVLDSVAGKLARLTFTSSRIGNLLDYGLDIVHPPVWYCAWAWALSGGNTASSVWQASVWMAVVYFLDRIVAGLFNRRTGRSIYGYTPLDMRLQPFISRRNINLPLFTVGLIVGVPVLAFVLIVLWQVVTFLLHAARLVQFWNDRTALEATG